MESKKFGKYMLLHRIAIGGMAEIFLAKQVGVAGFEKLVVIKRILPDLATETDFVRMFLDEARLASSMSHPNVVQIYDLGLEEKTYFITMEYIAGQDLHSIIRTARKRDKFIPLDLVARILIGACDGLQYAHTLKDTRGVPMSLIHRDVTPSNILVSYDGAVKVVDFGVAKAAGQVAKTQAGRIKGKFPYMAPEQIKMEPIDARVDVWSLGAVLFETLVLQRLFKADNELAILKFILDGPILVPSSVRSDCPPELDAIVAKATERDLNKRYLSAKEMRLDLEEYLKAVGATVGSAEVSAYVKAEFFQEFENHQLLLSEIPRATPQELANLIESNEKAPTGSSPLLSPSFESMPEFRVPQQGATKVTTPRRSARRWKPRVAVFLVSISLAASVASAIVFAWHRMHPSTLVAVGSEPSGAHIYLDGVSLDELSPTTIATLPLGGTHNLRLTKDGYLEGQQTFELDRKHPHQTFFFHLPGMPQLATSAREIDPTVKFVKRVVSKKEAITKEPIRAHRTGGVSLSSTPSAQVFLAGRNLGTTPLDNLILPASDVLLQFVNAREGLNQSVHLSVMADTKTKKTFVFRKGKLAADVQPWADVYIGDKKLGTTPLSPREIYEGNYVVRLVNSEIGALKTVNVTIRPGQTLVLRENLQP